jgi:hypothetical protein
VVVVVETVTSVVVGVEVEPAIEISWDDEDATLSPCTDPVDCGLDWDVTNAVEGGSGGAADAVGW